MAALGGDVARQPEAVQATFAAGIESLLVAVSDEDAPSDCADSGRQRAKTLDMLAHVVGAIVMSRACPDDSSLADEILASPRLSAAASALARERSKIDL